MKTFLEIYQFVWQLPDIQNGSKFYLKYDRKYEQTVPGIQALDTDGLVTILCRI